MYLIILSAVPLTLLLYCPVMTVVSAVTPWTGFRTASVRHRKKHYTTLHLSTFDRVGHLNLHRAARFHRSFLATLQLALQRDSAPVYFTSHLMRPAHMKSMTLLMGKMDDTHRWRWTTVSIPPTVRNGIRLQTLVQEWRWITVPETGVLVLIRPRRRTS
ncbi:MULTISPECIES: hypothetical protein [Enterobacteriaceae]|uniref:Uncharacterized protein n=3 Tax=Citrobacter freundii complex TaxID=1344959 RepID=A0ABR6U1C8_CITBR|nr:MULTISPECIES: hypothetical protein [Enterobacteriaceae]MBC2612917.1 hypothetical protein [Citrobacter braakii]MBC2636889.1 hypothetical protein [Citrobacter braakii]MBC2649608.1 hypothetical protein [Citrobacter braakii]MCL8106709.1 hypothetical protein [Enterobacter hormaechei]MCM8255707.1 hypothetical protein [Enterobacter hormaechei]